MQGTTEFLENTPERRKSKIIVLGPRSTTFKCVPDIWATKRKKKPIHPVRRTRAGLTVERDIARIEQRVQAQQEFGGHRWPSHGGQNGVGWPRGHQIGGGAVSAAACCCVVSAWTAAAATTECFVDVVGGDCDVAFRRDGESRATAAAGVHVVRAARRRLPCSLPPYEARRRLYWSQSSEEDSRQIRSNNHYPRLPNLTPRAECPKFPGSLGRKNDVPTC